MADKSDSNFLLYYQSLLFRGNNNDFENSFDNCSNRRKCMALASQASLNCDVLSLAVLDDHLKEYGSLVDARGPGAVDNYSASTLAIALNSKHECTEWVSSFKEPIHVPASLKSIFECECNNVTNEEVKKLLDAKRENDDGREENKINCNPFPTISLNLGNAAFIGENKSGVLKGPKNIPPKQSGFSFPRPLSTDMQVTTNNCERVNPHQNSFIPRQKLQSSTEEVVDRTESFYPSRANDSSTKNSYGHFITAREELSIQNQKKWSQGGQGSASNSRHLPVRNQKRLGTSRRPAVNDEFILPVRQDPGQRSQPTTFHRKADSVEIEEDERLKGIDPKMVEMVKNEIIDNGTPVDWDDIAGLDFAKATIQEIVVWPLLRPDIFFGLRGPPKGILLFGPPGTGKTLIGKCIASQSKSTFFSISASSLTSKWIGEGEKMVRALFAVARCHPPAVIFIDEIDSLLTQRNETDHESSRRIKTEFLVQLDGAATSEEDRILVIGATNRPQELDEAARRRLVKRLYIPLPEFKARHQIIVKLMSNQRNDLTSEDIHEVAKLTEGYSGADMKNLCREAALGPIRSIRFEDIEHIQPDQVRPVVLSDFTAALSQVRASVSSADLNQYIAWNNQYGCVEPK